MRYYQDSCIIFPVHLFESFSQSLHAPKIDPSLRLVEDGELKVTGQDGCYLYPLDLSSGKAGIDLTVQIILSTQPHVEKMIARISRRVFSTGYFQKFTHLDALKAGRLLKCVTDAHPGTFVELLVRYVHAIQQDPSAGWPVDTNDRLGRYRFSAAVGAGHYIDLFIFQGEIDIF